MKFMAKNGKRLFMIAAILTVAVAIVFTSVSVSMFAARAAEPDAEGESYYTSNYSSRQDVLDAGRDLSRQISGEGFVMLKNKNNALPLERGSRVTVLGKNSVNMVYSGGGSGGGPSGNRVDLYTALESTGFNLNPTMKTFYENDAESGEARPSNLGFGMIGRTIGAATYETPVEKYTVEQKRSFGVYDDLALIVISRWDSEGSDLPKSAWEPSVNSRGYDHSSGHAQVDDTDNTKPKVVAGRKDGSEHYLMLDDNEKALIKLANESFKKVAVVINSGSPIECGFLEEEEYGVDAALWIGCPGQTGLLALGDILNGTVNPSGHLTDTYVRDLKNTYSYNNFGLGDTTQYAGKKVDAVVNNNGTPNDTSDDTTTPAYFDLGSGNAFIVQPEANPVTVGSGSTATTYTWAEGKNTYSYNRYVKYKEGIYMGYRYYETMAAVNADEPTWYDDTVMYPFGYGLSYTSFDWEVAESNIDLKKPNGINTVNVKVTNVGDVAGKDVVQLYASQPYTGAIEKSSEILADFAKTKLLAPGESQTVELTFRSYDLASWDENLEHDSTKGAYVLETGPYSFAVKTDSHTAKVNSAANAGKTLTITDFNLTEDVEITKDPVTDKVLENKFGEAMQVANGLTIGADGKPTAAASTKTFETLTRAEMEKGHTTVLAGVLAADEEADREITVDVLQYLYENAYINRVYNVADNPDTTADETVTMDDLDKVQGSASGYGYYTTTMPKTSAGNTIGTGDNARPAMFRDLIGVDPSTDAGAALYQLVVENMSVQELGLLIGNASHQVAAVESIDMPFQYQEDGPGGFNTQADSMAFCNNIVIGATWNTELAEQMGEMMGEIALWEDIGGWYAPSVNLHRSEFAGRNFEYFSEDPVLSGDMVAAQIRGANRKGLMCTLKHFALNEQETDRGRSDDGVLTYANEQTIRELYLRPFEIAVKEGGATSIMGSFNRIGNTWASYYRPLNVDVLRNEWGFRGMVITDACSGQYMNGDAAIRGGTDTCLTSGRNPVGSNENGVLTATTVYLMQEAAKNTMYAVARCNAINEVLGYIAEDGQMHYTDKLELAEGTRRYNYFPLDLSDGVTDLTIYDRIEQLETNLNELIENGASSGDKAYQDLLAQLEALKAQVTDGNTDVKDTLAGTTAVLPGWALALMIIQIVVACGAVGTGVFAVIATKKK